MVYTSEKNRGLTLRLHFMLLVVWAVGMIKTLSQAAYAYRLHERRLLVQCLFLLAAQAANLACQAAALRTLRSINREDQLRQERTKAWLHVLLDISSMVCVILSDPALPHSPTPLSAMVVTSFLAVLDMFRLETLLRLQSIKWVCLSLLEADRYLRLPSHSAAGVGTDALHALALGTALPLVLALVSEATHREAFLRDCKRPASNLGPVWGAVAGALRRGGLGRGAGNGGNGNEQTQELHID